MLPRRKSFALASLFILCASVVGVAQRTPQSEITLSINEGNYLPPRYAVPDFFTGTPDADTRAVSKAIAAVLWDDLEFEREFYMIPRDLYASLPASPTLAATPFDRWRELGADGVVLGTIWKEGILIKVEVKIADVSSQRLVFVKEYSGTATNIRAFAHKIADAIHQERRALRGVARTKLTFASDRDAGRSAGDKPVVGLKEIYISDYDGANQRPITGNRTLSITPVWSPDARAIAFTSYRRGSPDILVAHIYQGNTEAPLRGASDSWLPAWSPDGSQLCFMSNRDGNPDLYIVNRDGSNLRRLTDHPGIDVTPTWSPDGRQVAFTSDRSGSPQIFIVDVESRQVRQITNESACDRATWSPAPFNEIAYASRMGPGYDIKIYDLDAGETRQITFGEGSNESPAYAPNGRHLAFTSTRSGKTQVFTVGRDGRGVKQITTVGNNFTPNWSQ